MTITPPRPKISPLDAPPLSPRHQEPERSRADVETPAEWQTASAAHTVLTVHPGAELFGSDRMFLESVAGMVGQGDRVVAALASDGPLVAELRSQGAEVVIAPMLVLRKSLMKPRGWPRLIRDTARGLISARRLLRRFAPDSVYISTITMPLWPLVGRLFGARVVSHVHEAEGSARTLVNRVLYLPHLLSHEVLVNSRFSLTTIERALPRLVHRSRIVHNGVAAPLDPPAPRTHIDGALRVTYVGRLSPRKGPDVALDAAAMLAAEGREVELTLVGAVFPGYEWFETELRAKAEESPANLHVRFAGFQPDVWGFLADTDILVVPSKVDEPFGNTAVEGILARRVVIASDTSGLREAAGGYAATTLVPPDDAAALSDALREASGRWAELVTNVDADRQSAALRHAPEVYRAAVRLAIVEGAPATIRSTADARLRPRSADRPASVAAAAVLPLL